MIVVQLWPPTANCCEPPYVPTEDEIAEECELIRNEWSEDEHVYRLRCDWRNGSAKLLIAPEPVEELL